MVSAYDIACDVPDPELPMLTLGDLGILRGIEQDGDTVTATITPTYSGCPAMREISRDVQHRLQRAGFANVTVRMQLAPAWTSEWITEAGRRKLAAAGIAPPHGVAKRTGPIPLTLSPAGTARAVTCPQCASTRTTRTAAFSGTACKALYRCDECREPFEYVKEI